MKLHSYIVARDFGFAPNPFYGVCTLATCKPKIRSVADIGDWIVGTGSKTNGLDGHLVYAMKVTEVMTFNDYWNNPRFVLKKPNLSGSKKQAFGDNIYYLDEMNGSWHQENSHHSFADGTCNINNVKNDTQTNRILISDDFIYWGGNGPALPNSVRYCCGFDLCAGRGHKNKFPPKLISNFESWLRARGERGYCGVPLDW